eukprot:m.63196 g.63196  ORF g.63196 m.63196 type:complete len:1176 (+) comp7179_c0_seq3:179-3706(+)
MTLLARLLLLLAAAAANNLILLDTTNNAWLELNPINLAAPSRIFGTSVMLNISGVETMLIYGGLGDNLQADWFGALNDVWTFLPSTYTWSFHFNASATAPCRLAHAAAATPDLQGMLVFGGITTPLCSAPPGTVNYIALNDLLLFNFSSSTWVTVQPGNSTVNCSNNHLPCARYLSAAATIGSTLFLSGGAAPACGFCPLDDLWMHTAAAGWSRVQTTNSPGGRFAHSLLTVNGTLFHISGCTASSPGTWSLDCENVTREVWTLACSDSNCASTWRLLNESGPVNIASPAGVVMGRDGPAIAALDFGGQVFSFLDLGNVSTAWEHAVLPSYSPQVFPLYGASVSISPSRNSAIVLPYSFAYGVPPLIYEFGVDVSCWFTAVTSLPTGLVGFSFMGVMDELSNQFVGYVLNGLDANFNELSTMFGVYPVTSSTDPQLLVTPIAAPVLPPKRLFSSWSMISTPNGALAVMYGGGQNWPQGSSPFMLHDDTWIFNPATAQWRPHLVSGPGARAFHSYCSIRNIYAVIMFGIVGTGAGTYFPGVSLQNSTASVDNHVWFFSGTNFSWFQPLGLNNGTGPAPRFGATISHFQGGIFVFSGAARLSTDVLSDAWLIADDGQDIDQLTWSPLTQVPSNPLLGMPSGRFLAAVTLISESVTVINGGSSASQILDDTWTGRLVNGNWLWAKVAVINSAPAVGHTMGFWPTNGHGDVGIGESSVLVLIGGLTSGLNTSNFGIVFGPIIVGANLTCGQGQYGSIFSQCQSCQAGTYQDTLGSSQCSSCPPGTTSTGPGASSVRACSICVPNYCHGHGACSVAPAGSSQVPLCSCDPAWFGTQCGYTWPPILVALLLLAVGVTVGVQRAIRRHRMFLQLQNESALNEHLLEERTMELDEMQRAWEIRENEITLDRKVDEGSFGEVFKATFRELPVAVKKIKLTMSEDIDAASFADFEREAKIMRAARHNNVLLFFGFGRFTSGAAFLVIEWAARGSLRRLLHSPAVDLARPTRLQLCIGAARGMEYLHAGGRIHRDLKSANILVTEGWVAKVADFGTARLLGAMRSEIVESYELPDTFDMTRGIGTLLWSAPEILRGHEYGLPADVYSFAVILWEVWTRRLPFENLKSTWQVRDAVEAGVRPPLPEDMDPDYAALIGACWQDPPHARPSFTGAAVQLEALLARIATP